MADSKSWVEHAMYYIPQDRRWSMAHSKDLPEKVEGSVLFADISGFTPLTEALTEIYGLQRGAEELSLYLNNIYDALIGMVNNYGGSVISFSGDAITCWFDDQLPPSQTAKSSLRAIACALHMQSAIQSFAQFKVAGRDSIPLAVKVAVSSGPACRFLVGDPSIMLFDVLAGETLSRVAQAESFANPHEILLDKFTAGIVGEAIEIKEWRREGHETQAGQDYAVVTRLKVDIEPAPWPDVTPDQLIEEQVRSWLHPAALARLKAGKGEFLTEIRPTVPVFLRFSGIDYDHDPNAGLRLHEYITSVQKVVDKYGGNLLEITTGDKGSYLYISFGACTSHEDDTRRAVSAALNLEQLNIGLGSASQVQIGVSRGTMRCGAYGSSTRRSFGALGDDVNLAARLMSQAAPGEVLVSRRVHKEISNVKGLNAEGFTFEARPPIHLKGKTEPIPVFAIIGLELRRSLRLQEPAYGLPMVGRETELAFITSKMALALQGKGQVIGISGEPGIGKSRLMAEAIHIARTRGFVGYGGACQSDGTQTSFLVWKPIWWAFFDLDPEAPLRRQIHSLESEVDYLVPDRLEALPLLGELLGLPIPENDFTRTLEPKHRFTALEALLVDCLHARSLEISESGGGLLLVLEDVHWIDSASHDLLERLTRSISSQPIVLLLAYRPPEIARVQEPRVETLPYFSHLRLSELTNDQIEQSLRAKLAQLYPEWQGSVPKAIIERLITQAQGNPFYAEELINYLHDRDLDLRDQTILDKVDLPASLNSLVISRIDQLTASQQLTIKIASVLGRVFRFKHLLGYYPELGEQVQVKSDLDTLSACELTPLDSPEPELAYLYKHLITHDVAYGLLTHSAQARLHERYADYIETTSGDQVELFLDQLSYHYEHSENQSKKREYLLKAGHYAQKRYANQAALDYYERALPILTQEEKPEILINIGQVLELVGKWSEAKDAYEQALLITTQLGDLATQAGCLSALGELERKGGHYSAALEYLEQAKLIFTELGNIDGQAQVYHFQGTVATHKGELETAKRLYEDSLEIRRKQGDLARTASLLSNLGIIERVQGHYDLARDLNEEALSLRKGLGDKWAIAVSLNNLGNVAIDQCSYAEAKNLLEEALTLRREVGDMWVVANSLNNLGNLARDQGNYQEANSRYRESLSIVAEYNDRWALAYLLEDMARLACLQGHSDRTLRLIGAADALRQVIGAPRSSAEQQKLDSVLETARNALGESNAMTFLNEGQAMNFEAALVYANNTS